jgi:hypothetical protein
MYVYCTDTQLIEALVSAFNKCTVPQQQSASTKPATVTTTTVTTTTTASAASTTTTTSTTVSTDADASTGIHTLSSGSNSVTDSTSVQRGSPDAPEIKVKLEKAKVCVVFYYSVFANVQAALLPLFSSAAFCSSFMCFTIR